MSTIALLVPTERGCICAVHSGMNDENKEEQVMLWRAAVMALGRALRQEYEQKQEEMPEHMRQLVTQLETAGKPKNEESSD
jgi:hypothetical protein